MRLAHNVRISVYCKDWQDCDAIERSLTSMVPFDMELEKENVKKTLMKAERALESDITILEIILTKERHVNAFFKHLNEKLGAEQTSLLIKQNATRFDEELNFFLRLDMKELMAHQKYELTDSGECFHIRISIAAFPKRYDTALFVLKQIFQSP